MKDKVLITGAGGFIGSHLAEMCVKEGYAVNAFVHYNSRGTWGWLETSPLKEDMEVSAGDLRDFDSVVGAMRGCRRVFHLAALIGIPYSYVSPLAYVKTNVEGTYNVLQAAKDLGVERIVHTSTSEVYGTARFVPITEEHPINPQSPYAATKAAADYLALTYHRSFGLPVAVIRPFNTFGPRQSARAVIPAIAVQILSGKKTVDLGSLSPTRDLTYVSDTVAGFLAVDGSAGAVGNVINIGMNLEITIGELARLIAGIVGTRVEIREAKERVRPGPSEVRRLLADSSRARQLLGWHPEYDLERGLKETIAWLEKNLESYKADLYNV
jgi:NAD dependent epimerase/dehydratase